MNIISFLLFFDASNGNNSQQQSTFLYLGIKLGEQIKVSLEICGQNSFNRKKPEAFEFHRFQPAQEVKLWI